MTGAGGLRVRCPAKINLGLRVLAKRPDGYHEIETIFQAIDLWDELEARPAGEVDLECDDASLPTDGRNLVVRAADALRSAGGARGRGARLTLRKRIPVGGGLGGGSADAAGALVLLDRLWDLRLEAGDLERLAADLGSDVPFFLRGGTALGRGRGERVSPLPSPGVLHLVLGVPGFPISTADVYARLPLRLTTGENDVSLASLFSKYVSLNDFGAATNDLEEAAFGARPELRVFRDALRATGARPALISGSGSSVFGVFRDAEAAGSAGEGLAARFRGWKVMTCRSVDRGIEIGADPGAGRGARELEHGSH